MPYVAITTTSTKSPNNNNNNNKVTLIELAGKNLLYVGTLVSALAEYAPA